MPQILRLPSEFKPFIHCLMEITISEKNYIGFNKINSVLDDVLKTYSLSEREVCIYFEEEPVFNNKLNLKLKIQFEKETENCIALLEYFLFSVGNVRFYQKRLEYGKCQ